MGVDTMWSDLINFEKISYRVLLGHTANFKLFGHLDEIDQILIVDMHFTHVHEIQNCPQHIAFYTVDEKHRMWAWVFLIWIEWERNK